MISVEEATSRILAAVGVLPAEPVALSRARGRILAEDVWAPRDLPPCANSAMDGFAFRHADLVGPSGPRRLRVVGVVGAGGAAPLPVGPGEAVKVMTGAPVPAGLDTVVPVEDTVPHGREVDVLRLPAQGAHVRPAGEDVRAGVRVLARGARVRPAEVALVAGLGLASVVAYRRPRVAVLATGDEVVEPGQPAEDHQTYDANSYGIAAQVEEAGAVALRLGVARDRLGALREALERAGGADALVTSGGISAGDFDFLDAALADWGVSVQFRKVAMKPGKPFVFGLREAMPVFALPGNPVAAMTTFEQFVRPALRAMQGDPTPLPEFHAAVLGPEAGPVRSKRGRREFARCVVAGDAGGYRVARVTRQGSALLSTLVEANGLMVLPEESEGAVPGQEVVVQFLGGVPPRRDAEALLADAPGGEAGARWGSRALASG